MALLDFYAAPDDQRDLVRFLLDETDVVLYEASSRIGEEPRVFRSLEELEACVSLDRRRAVSLRAWSRSVTARPLFRRIELDAASGGSFRFVVEAAGLIQLDLDGTQQDVLHHTHYGHWNEAGARARSIAGADDCDWGALRTLSGRIQRHIRGRLSVAMLHARPILGHAYAALQRGRGLRFGPDVHRADSPAIVRRASDSARRERVSPTTIEHPPDNADLNRPGS